MKFSRIRAIMGVKSNMPVEGKTCRMTARMGARIGSVTWKRIVLIGSLPVGETHDMMTLPKMAKFKAYTRYEI